MIEDQNNAVLCASFTNMHDQIMNERRSKHT